MTNYIIDPLQQLRPASFYTLTFENERYLNAGLAKTYPYNSVIIGSSMTENFHLDNIKDILKFKNPIKLSIRGASAYEEALTLQTAFNHRSIDQVLIGFDSYSFNGNASEIMADNSFFPRYLYEDSIIGNMRYLTNYKTFERGLKYLKKPYDAKVFANNFNMMYSWQSDCANCFTENNVRSDWERLENNLNHSTSEERAGNQKLFSNTILVENFKKTFLPIVKNHPETQFYIFFPPYSLLAFKIMYYDGTFDDHIAFKKSVSELMRPYKNVALFDFQSVNNVTTNLANYKDYTHYHDKINLWILEQIKNDNYRVFDFSDARNDRFKQQITKLDINELFINSFNVQHK
jgi:hypothetical protein